MDPDTLSDEDKQEDDSCLQKFIDTKIGHLSNSKSKRPRRLLEARTTSVDQEIVKIVQQGGTRC